MVQVSLMVLVFIRHKHILIHKESR